MKQGELFTAFLVDLQRIFRTEVVPKNLSYSQVLAIIIIPDDGIEMSELARTLGLENSTVTRLIARLERNNYVTRKKSEADRKQTKTLARKRFFKMVKDPPLDTILAKGWANGECASDFFLTRAK